MPQPPRSGGGAPAVSPRTRLVLFAVIGAVIGITIGVDVANESYGWVVLAGLIGAWLVLKRLSPAKSDAWLVAATLVGYVVGNRGFAQLQPSGLLPLLPAEGVLLFAVPALAFRMALKQSPGFRRDALNFSILIWAVIGACRLPLDMSRFGVIALRDFAMIYYAAFFFIAQAFGAATASGRVLTRGLTVAFVALLPVVISILISPDFLIDNLTWRGIPIIYHKSDLIATSLAAGFFWLWTRWDKTRRRGWLVLAAASLLLIGGMASPRAGMFGVAVTTLLWLLTGRWRIAAFQAGMVAAASVVALAVPLFTGGDLKTSAPYSMYEHAVSIFDPAGTGTYVNNESGDLGGNNQFRLIWWRDVIEDTAAINPVFGLGFGADLSTRFLADYDLLSDETFAARSPHSMLVTVFGRMGIAGFAAWIAVSAAIARLVWRLLRRGVPDGMGLASIVTVIWLSACFGVVLEGPMGAVIFWTVLGLANSSLESGAPAGADAPAGGRESAGPGEWPVAKRGALGTQSVPR
jgi:hypothetical protein